MQKRENTSGIMYPDAIYYGQSLLTLPDSAILEHGKSYGFAAILGKDAALAIIMTDISPIDSGTYRAQWYYSTPTGWLVSGWSGGTQKFTATQTGKIDLPITFYSSWDTTGPGICKLDFYENGSAITKTKYIRWQ